MKETEMLTDEEFDNCLLKVNKDWRIRLSKDPRYIHYDYESNILHLRFGRPRLYHFALAGHR